jgi:hypothetical protein
MTLTRSVGLALASAVAATLIANHVFGMPLIWSIVLSLPAAAVVLLVALLSGSADANWEAVPGPGSVPVELQASMLAARLAEAQQDHQRFATRVQPRLARIALATLRARPETADVTTVDDPRARDALGDELHRLVTDPRARLPEPRRLAALLARLEDHGNR